MNWTWGDFWLNSRKWLKTGWLLTAGLVAVYIGVIEPRQMDRGVASSRATGLGAVTGGSIFPWRQQSPSSPGRFEAYIGGGGGGGDRLTRSTYVQSAAMAMKAPSALTSEADEERKLVRTCSMYLLVKTPSEDAEKIRQMAEHMGGYLENSQINGSQLTGSASLTIRVPSARIEEARAEIRKLALRVESDRLEAQDVTKDYVDREARLRNLHAQEEQYLAIMKRAMTVKDALEVSEQLNQVRGQIEQEQAEFNALSKQVQTVAITVSLNAEADAQVFGLSWRPLFRLKMAARDGLEGFGDYIAAMTALVFYVPTILLWLGTILIGAAMGWRILRSAARFFFSSPNTVLTEKGAN